MRKLYLSTKFPYQEIKWNYGIFRSALKPDWQNRFQGNCSLSYIGMTNLVKVLQVHGIMIVCPNEFFSAKTVIKINYSYSTKYETFYFSSKKHDYHFAVFNVTPWVFIMFMHHILHKCYHKIRYKDPKIQYDFKNYAKYCYWQGSENWTNQCLFFPKSQLFKIFFELHLLNKAKEIQSKLKCNFTFCLFGLKYNRYVFKNLINKCGCWINPNKSFPSNCNREKFTT